MYALLLMTVLLDPWVEITDFPRPIQEKAFAATLRLKVGLNEGTAVRVGRLKPNGHMYYLTAAHVVGEAKSVDLESFDPKTGKVSKTIPGVDVKATWPGRDLALLRAAEADPVEALPISPKQFDPLKPQRFPVLSVGCTNGNKPEIWPDEVTKGVLVNKDNKVPHQCWEVRKKSVVGRSGGPLIDKDGHLVGICSGNKNEDAYYVHIAEIQKCLKDQGLQALFEKKPE